MLKITKWGTTGCIRNIPAKKSRDFELYKIKDESTKFSSVEFYY